MNAPDATINVTMTDRMLAAAAKGIRLPEVRAALPNLEALCHHKIAAADAFSDACKAAGEKANLSPSVISAYVTAIVRDKLEDKREKAEQLALLFEEIGE